MVTTVVAVGALTTANLILTVAGMNSGAASERALFFCCASEQTYLRDTGSFVVATHTSAVGSAVFFIGYGALVPIGAVAAVVLAESKYGILSRFWGATRSCLHRLTRRFGRRRVEVVRL